jgi:hypothetical protein
MNPWADWQKVYLPCLKERVNYGLKFPPTNLQTIMQTYDSFNALAAGQGQPLVSGMSVFNSAATETTNDRHSHSGRANNPANENASRQDVHDAWGVFADTLTDYGHYSDISDADYDALVKDYANTLMKSYSRRKKAS